MSKQAEPVHLQQRIVALDMLRGFAVLGILFMNIYAYAMPISAYNNPLSYGGDDWLNLSVWYFTHLIADQKFISLFSIMFGASLLLVTERYELKANNVRTFWFRRVFWLALIGLLHFVFLWMGDILLSYALVGLLIFPLRKRSAKQLITFSIISLCIAIALISSSMWYVQSVVNEGAYLLDQQQVGAELTEREKSVLQEYYSLQEELYSPEEVVATELEVYRAGYQEIVSYRFNEFASEWVQVFIFYSGWWIASLMLLGMALQKTGVLLAARSTVFYQKMLWVSLGIGAPLVLLSSWLLTSIQWDEFLQLGVGGIPNTIGSIFLALAYIAAVILFVRSKTLPVLQSALAAVGRMALSNYLLQSVVMTSIFYGYGLGLFGGVPRIGQMAFVLVFFALQLVLSQWWLKRYRFGPVEWLWRSLTYWRIQPWH